MTSVRFQGQIIFPKVFTQPGNPYDKVFTPPAKWELQDWKARPDAFYYVDLATKDEKGVVKDEPAVDVAAVTEFLKKGKEIPFAYKPSSYGSFMAAADNPVSDDKKILPLVMEENPFSWVPKEHR